MIHIHQYNFNIFPHNTYDNGIQNEPLSNKIKMISTLEPKQQEAIITIIDSILKERRMKEVLNQTLINV